jgi:lipopolysaccharide export LptBFGC system permease protein LptF
VDERYHLEKSTALACNYLKKTYEQTGFWSTAAASYNAGRGRITSVVETQQTNNYFEMLFGEETNRYVFRMIVAKQIFSDPQKYGFYLKKEDLYYLADYDIVEVDFPIPNLTDFAKTHGTNYQLLKDLNPWLRTNKLDNKSKKTYFIKIPKKNAVKFDPKKIRVYQDNWVVNP